MTQRPANAATTAEVDPDAGSDDAEQAVLTALLASAAEGDEAAWRKLIDLYARRVFALCKSRCRSADLAEEITQSVFATVAVKITSGEYDERNRFEPWLFRIAMNRIRDEMRRARRHADPTDPTIVADLASAAGGSPRGGEAGFSSPSASHDGEQLPADLSALRDAMGRLSDADREIVELRHHAGLTFKQIAELLSEPIGTLLARHHRALRKLRDMLTPADGATPGAVGLGGGGLDE